jgi:glycosyltransferase involved in cell wall biosynthesis
MLCVVIPTHNRAEMLAGAIASVVSSKVVTHPARVIVVDDASDDRSREVARGHGATYLRVTRRSIGASRNAGLASVSTPYVSFLDDDDAWLTGNMEPQLAALEADPSAAFAYGVARCATEKLEPLPWTYPSPPLASGVIPRRLHLGYPQIGTVLFRREAIATVGGFDEGMQYGEDAELMVRLAVRNRIIGVDMEGVLHRLRSPSRRTDDYYWSGRQIAWWFPRRSGIDGLTAAKYMLSQRSVFWRRLSDDAQACAERGESRDALVCLARATRMSPLHALRHARRCRAILSVAVRGPDKKAATPPRRSTGTQPGQALLPHSDAEPRPSPVTE